MTRFCRWLAACADELRFVYRAVQRIRAEALIDQLDREEP